MYISSCQVSTLWALWEYPEFWEEKMKCCPHVPMSESRINFCLNILKGRHFTVVLHCTFYYVIHIFWMHIWGENFSGTHTKIRRISSKFARGNVYMRILLVPFSCFAELFFLHILDWGNIAQPPKDGYIAFSYYGGTYVHSYYRLRT